MSLAILIDAPAEQPFDLPADIHQHSPLIVSLEDRHINTDIEMRNLGNQLITGTIDVMLFVSRWGFDRFFETCRRSIEEQRLVDSLSDVTTIICNESLLARFAELGIQPDVEFSEPNNWRDVLVGIDCSCQVVNQTVAIEAAADGHSLTAGLEARGASVEKIPTTHFEGLLNDGEQSLVEGVLAGSVTAIVVSDHVAALRLEQIRHRHRAAFEKPLVVIPQSVVADGFRQKYDDPWVVDSLATIQSAELVRHLEQRQNSRIQWVDRTNQMEQKQAAWYDSPFMKAVRLEPAEVTPVWLMRQAGRYMQEYREVRAKTSFLDLCKDPALCSEVMCTAVNRLGVDAAIIFSDLLPILEPMGMDLEFVSGDGPVIHNPVREAADVDRVARLESVESLDFVMETVRQTRRDLPGNIPLIGFAGAPFTLASYMIEGGSSRNYRHAKTLMFGDSGAWEKLMGDLTHSITLYLQAQVEAGAQVVQLFDSWAGCLNVSDYRRFVLPYVQEIVAAVAPLAPVINFATGNPALLPLLAETRAAVVGVDWRVDLATAWQAVGYDRAVQGNLDPTVLLAGKGEIRRRAAEVLSQAEGRAGHIFNLGHGVLPQTDVDHVIALVEAVHELSQQ
ncbi:MAG: uroporphyrinogen decarboxylase [Mariniblastus sp.]|nr:uroporphyrinogen decarboxylase [Mariniblastus sp.]